jgi:hypothetical protein
MSLSVYQLINSFIEISKRITELFKISEFSFLELLAFDEKNAKMFAFTRKPNDPGDKMSELLNVAFLLPRKNISGSCLLTRIRCGECSSRSIAFTELLIS